MSIYVTESEYTRKGADSLEFAKQIVNSRKRYWIQSEFIMISPSVSQIYNEFDIFDSRSEPYGISL